MCSMLHFWLLFCTPAYIVILALLVRWVRRVDWRFRWRSFAIKFYWHKTEWTTATGYDAYKVSCDWHEHGCLDSCRRQRKLAAWEAADAARAVPKAQLLSSKTSDTIR